MLFKELAAMYSVSCNTFRKMLRASDNEKIRALGQKRGTGSYFYNRKEVDFLLKNLTFSKNI
jgi:hypothetical protein